MKSNISGKAKRLTSWMALTAAVCAGALAVAVLLFFEVWWAGLIALAVSMLGGVATVLLFMAYQADRRRNMRRTEEEEEDARIMALLEMSHSQSGTNTEVQEAAKYDKRGNAETATEAEEGTTDNNASSGNSENISEEEEDRPRENEDGESKPSTLEMRPPLKLLTVEEARSHTKGDEKERDDNAQDDKNGG